MDDLISRKAAIDAIHEDADWLAAQGNDWQTERMERDRSILRSLPSAQPERKTGRWIIHRDWIANGECGYECSECGRCYDYDMNYCGYCGCKMEVEHGTKGIDGAYI